MKEQLEILPHHLAAHLGLTLVALALGIAVSVPLGVLATRYRRLEAIVLGIASIIQTIPSLALLAIMVPVLAAMGAPSIGYLPALIGLFLYSLLPVLRNTVVGLSSIDPAVIEAARGVGMTPREQLLRVEIPLALPVIIAGIRTAAVWTVGTATLSTPIGASSLGDYIFSGLQTRNFDAVLVGCVASAGLALVLDGLARGVLHGVRTRSRRVLGMCLVGFGLLVAFAVVFPVRGWAASRRSPAIRIGSKTFTEQYILSRVVAGRVASAIAGAGARAEVLDSLGSTVVFDALKTGQIDAYVDYTGTLWATVLGHSDADAPADRAGLLEAITRELAERYGVLVACSLGFENTYVLAMRRANAERLGVRRVSDLGRGSELRLAGDYEIFQRKEWRSIERTYGLAFKERRIMDPSLFYDAARDGHVDVITAFSTDGRLVSYDLATLEDDRHAIPPYDAVVLVGPRLAREHPEAILALRRLAGSIDAPHMRAMNAAVDDRREAPASVAARFLADAP